MRLLVAGGDRVDAGKTTFAVGLAARLAAEGVGDPDSGRSVEPFKPRAGNDYWFDHDDVLAATADGRLYGKDVRRLTDVAGGVPEERNPVHRLWRPTPGRTGMLGDPNRTFLLDRVSTPDGTTWVRNANVDLPDPIRERLPVADARDVDSVEAFNDAMQAIHLPALEGVAERVRAADAALVESYGDVADPLPGAGVDYDAVAAVEPGRARVYDGDRWEAARAAAAGSDAEGQLEERVEPVTRMVDPVSTHALPALSGPERADPDSVSDANRSAYDALLGVAGE
ncbi:ATPase [Halorarum halophilum]|uniref:ATPase n=1 Tax=Halorarum halophilum TaxID=2743090 RepID=A0A7D5GWI3_9EURY|nr:ATPase [Halobaculum halophilum]QLG26929.1 ATPase [Halobaculum halophilum]